MRRSDREITNQDEILEIIHKCGSCSVAFYDDEYPYILPMNFGVAVQEDGVSLIFHSANAGTKLKLIEKNDKVAFEMNTSHKLLLSEIACKSTMEYESVCGNGVISIIGGDEKRMALKQFMDHYVSTNVHKFSENEIKSVVVLKLEVHNMVGKRLSKK